MSIDKFHNPYRFENFKLLAADNSLSKHQKIGFPENYRSGKEEAIFRDITGKLEIKNEPGQIFLEIGPGCSDLPKLLHACALANGCKVVLVDSKEMLDLLLPGNEHTIAYAGQFPDEVIPLLDAYQSSVDYIVIYSILHGVFGEGCIYKFIDSAVSLLKPGGKLLIGDVPNISKRKRFFSSEAGKHFHKKFMNTDEDPEVHFNQLEEGQIDDGVILGILQRYRGFGLDTYLLPQDEELPFANRREDILIVRN